MAVKLSGSMPRRGACHQVCAYTIPQTPLMVSGLSSITYATFQHAHRPALLGAGVGRVWALQRTKPWSAYQHRDVYFCACFACLHHDVSRLVRAPARHDMPEDQLLQFAQRHGCVSAVPAYAQVGAAWFCAAAMASGSAARCWRQRVCWTWARWPGRSAVSAPPGACATTCLFACPLETPSHGAARCTRPRCASAARLPTLITCATCMPLATLCTKRDLCNSTHTMLLVRATCLTSQLSFAGCSYKGRAQTCSLSGSKAALREALVHEIVSAAVQHELTGALRRCAHRH